MSEADALEEGILTTDDDEEESLDEVEEEETEEKEEVDWQAKIDEALEAERAKWDEKASKADEHIANLNKAVHQLRQENKALKKSGGKDDAEAEFTDAQLLQIMEENKDDPGVMLQAMKQLVKQGNADVEKIATKKVEIAERKAAMDPLIAPWKEYMEQSGDVLDKLKADHFLADHPFADHLAMGIVLMAQYPQLMEKAKEDAKKEALGEKAEKARKDNISKTKPDTKPRDGDTGDDGIKQSWVDSANRIGLKGKARKNYFNMMKKSSKKEA